MNNQERLSQLLHALDSDGRAARKDAARALVEIGEDAVDALLASAHDINLRLLSGHVPVSELPALRERIRILGLIKSERAIKMVSAALADSSEMIHNQKAVMQRIVAAFIPDVNAVSYTRDLISVAEELHRTAFRALIRIGDEAERQLSTHMDSFSDVAQKSIRRALRRIKLRRFWRRFLGRSSQPMPRFSTGNLDGHLLQAASNVDVDGVRDALVSGANPNVREPAEKQSPLHLCICARRSQPQRVALGTIRYYRPIEKIEAIVDLLLKAGADVNAGDDDGETALHWASGYGFVNIIRSLLQAGADVNAQDRFGMTPLHQAASSGAKDAAEALISAGAEVNRRMGDGRTPLAMAQGLHEFLGGEGPDLAEPLRDLLRRYGATL